MSYAPLGDNSEGSDRLGQQQASGEPTYDGEAPSRSSSSSTSLLMRNNKSSSLSEPLTTTSDSMDAASSDPFHVFRHDLYKALERVDESLAEYLRIVHETDTAVNGHELKAAKKQLKRHLKHAEATMKDVETSVQLVEQDRDAFGHVDDTELYERASLVQTSKDRLNRAKQDMSSSDVKAKLLQDERAKAVRRAGADSLGATNDAQRQNTNAIIDSQAQTSLLMQQQDETLDDLHGAVTRVGEMAESIHDEIGQQNKMLDDMEEDLAHAEEELGLVMGKLAKFLKTKDTWQLGTIVALFLTMVVLFFLVVYT